MALRRATRCPGVEGLGVGGVGSVGCSVRVGFSRRTTKKALSHEGSRRGAISQAALSASSCAQERCKVRFVALRGLKLSSWFFVRNEAAPKTPPHPCRRGTANPPSAHAGGLIEGLPNTMRAKRSGPPGGSSAPGCSQPFTRLSDGPRTPGPAAPSGPAVQPRCG